MRRRGAKRCPKSPSTGACARCASPPTKARSQPAGWQLEPLRCSALGAPSAGCRLTGGRQWQPLVPLVHTTLSLRTVSPAGHRAHPGSQGPGAGAGEPGRAGLAAQVRCGGSGAGATGAPRLHAMCAEPRRAECTQPSIACLPPCRHACRLNPARLHALLPACQRGRGAGAGRGGGPGAAGHGAERVPDQMSAPLRLLRSAWQRVLIMHWLNPPVQAAGRQEQGRHSSSAVSL